MKASDVGAAVQQVEHTPDEVLDDALRLALPVLVALISNIPWWRQVFVGLRVLIAAINAYLDERNRS